MSSTDSLGDGSIHSINSDDDDVSPNRRSSTSKDVVSRETKIEIEELIDDIPQLEEVFSISNKIGSGTFSSVYIAQLKNCPNSTEKFALKHIIPTSHPSRIESELRCLQEIGGCDNVMGVKACIRERDHVVIVMPYFPHDRFQDYVQNITVGEVRDYMKNLLLALRRVHEVDIIHRDVKPTNFLFNRKLKKFALVDFGLAQKAPVPLRQNSTPPSRAASSTSRHSGVTSSAATTTPAAVPVPAAEGKDAKLSRTSKQQPQPLSPRKTNIPNVEVKVSQSPRKRKMSLQDVENFPESPRKKRAVLGDAKHAVVGLVEINPNVPKMDALLTKAERSPVVKLHKVDSKALTPPIGLDNPAYLRNAKSPRRALLTKRALDMQKVPNDVSKPSAGAKVAGPNASATALRNQRKAVVVEKNGKQMYRTVAPAACPCFGRPYICSTCLARSNQAAPRAGTPGFRAPEVLMKCPGQTTAVDIWSAGVIFLSLLSGRYPFFKSADDFTALAQIVSVFGTEQVRTAAKNFGKTLTCSSKVPGYNLKMLCDRLRGVSRSPRMKTSQLLSEKAGLKKQATPFPDTAFDLLERLLDLDPNTRITAEDALQHPFFTEA